MGVGLTNTASRASRRRLSWACVLTTALSLLTVSLAPASHAANAGPPTNISVSVGNQVATVKFTCAWDDLCRQNYNSYQTWVQATTDANGQHHCWTSGDSCTFSNLTNGFNYTFTLSTVTNGSTYSPAAVVGPYSPCCSLADPPSNVTAVPGDSSAKVSWSAPTNPGIGSNITYTITVSPGGDRYSTKSTSATVPNLANGTAYAFTVTSSNSQGESKASAASPIITVSGPAGAPTGVRAFPGDRGVVNVAWNPPVSNGGTPITKYVATSSPGDFTCQSTGSASCQMSGPSNGVAYTFTVVAFNAAGPGPASAPSAPIRRLVAAAAPTNVTAKASGTSASVSWRPPASTGGLPVKSYVATAFPSKRVCKTSGTKCSFAGLPRGARYTFLVQAVTAKGPGAGAMSPAVSTAPLPAVTQSVTIVESTKPPAQLS